MKYTFELVKNKDLSFKNLKKVADLKCQHWKYSIDEQVKWIKENIKDNDSHLLLLENTSTLIGYMNLVKIVVKSDLGEKAAFGIGNVCISKNVRKKGNGILLMQMSIFILNNFESLGILLCKPELNQFYQKSGWFLFNGNTEIGGASFKNSVFTNNFLNSSNLYLDKSF
jgi:predicted GNAT family N-acyltransferase